MFGRALKAREEEEREKTMEAWACDEEIGVR
ncbi:uncharacterized protein G2W53_029128 [Senna tora]|uniref:Uncharacterized protein n=1 Tax=Senna tora TaxID=362788 RepID=A0A834TDG4_9FABA|nr:uncharacterized protein G2W53_029128 [Senna tora]